MAASNIYSLEPTTRGAVLLRTSAGDILIELFARECPLAVRNFCQLCVDGAYDGAPFSRVVPGTLVQAGPEGKDESSFEAGEGFKDEFHSRLEFRGRGMVAMANEGKPSSNRAHFFITLKQCPWLNRKHTIFGIIRGEPVYVAVKIGESPVDGEKALFPSTIKQAIIIEQPFPDDPPIVPRAKKSMTQVRELESGVKSSTQLLKKLKPTSALSFAAMDDDDDEEVVLKNKKVNPALRPKAKSHPTSQAAVSESVAPRARSSSESSESSSSSSSEKEIDTHAAQRDDALAARLSAFAAKRKAS